MRTWLITGASSGIGLAVAEQVLERGDRVAALARRTARLHDLAARFGDQVRVATVDVTDTPELRRVVHRMFSDLGRIDVVFSNAGSGAFGAGEELSDAAIEKQIALNLLAPIQLTRAVLPHLRAQGGGRIIQTSTMGGQMTSPGGSMYHASKWGIEGFLESIIPEVAPFGIGITLVEPGNVRTGFGAALSIAHPLAAYADTPVGPIRRFIESAGNLTGNAPGDPQRVAAAIIASADGPTAPRRLALGSDSYLAIRAALLARLSELDAAREISATTDFPAERVEHRDTPRTEEGHHPLDAKTVAREFWESWGRGDLDATWRDYVADDIEIHPSSGYAFTRETWLQAEKALHSAFTDIQVAVLDQMQDGDKVATRWSVTARQTGEFFGVPSSGRTAVLTGTTVDRVRDGLITEHWAEVGVPQFLQQLAA